MSKETYHIDRAAVVRELKADMRKRGLWPRQPVPGVYGPEQHAAGFVAKEVG